jgi:hypothetical protein
LSQTIVVIWGHSFTGTGRAFLVWFSDKSFWQVVRGSKALRLFALFAVALASLCDVAAAQNVRQWNGTLALNRQPAQVFANTLAEWRSLWSRVGQVAPDLFEPGRTSAVGIFLGQRSGPGYSVNILSAGRRRDRFMLVFEERAPDDVMMAERTPSAPRPVAANPAFAPGGAASFVPQSAAPPSVASLPPIPSRPTGPPTSPWAIVLIDRVDLPITVEQRLFR